MSGGDGFLTRWSRRKLGVHPEESPPVVPAPFPGPEPVTESPGEKLPDEELALLPRIEDLTPESDISAFLRNGVPDFLKKAALRRMWALDPAIRDYVGDARDYAWDWNLPGDVPCSGPLLASDEMTARIQQMFSRAPGQKDEGESPDEEANDATASAAPAISAEAAAVDQEQPELPSAPASELASVPLPQARNEPAPVESGSVRQDAPLRRHGAAIPKLDLF